MERDTQRMYMLAKSLKKMATDRGLNPSKKVFVAESGTTYLSVKNRIGQRIQFRVSDHKQIQSLGRTRTITLYSDDKKPLQPAIPILDLMSKIP